MPYPEMLVAPMRQDLVRIGFQELRSADEVDTALGETGEPVLVVVNSVCGCAAGGMRPAVALSLRDERVPRPARLTTVFAGQDVEATTRAREYFTGYGPPRPPWRSSMRARWSGCLSGTRSRATIRRCLPRC